MLCNRNANNQTPRDLAESLNLQEHVNVIDQSVCDWIVSNAANAKEMRTILALFSWDLNRLIKPNSEQQSVRLYQQECMRLQVSSLSR